MRKKEQLNSPTILRLISLNANETQIDLITDKQAVSRRYNLKTQELPRLIEIFLKEQGINLKEVNQLEIDDQKGSLTGYRIARSVAQALHFSANIPFNDKSEI